MENCVQTKKGIQMVLRINGHKWKERKKKEAKQSEQNSKVNQEKKRHREPEIISMICDSKMRMREPFAKHN